jgi:hypothetical protein
VLGLEAQDFGGFGFSFAFDSFQILGDSASVLFSIHFKSWGIRVQFSSSIHFVFGFLHAPTLSLDATR